MARICACCEHPRRTAIEAQLVSGRSLRTVAADFGLRPAALHRHSQNHLSASLGAAAQAHQTAAQPQGTQSAQPFRPTELQPVATEEAQHSASLANRRALQLEDASGNRNLPAPSTSAGQSSAANANANETTSQAATIPAVPLDPYALACELRDNAVTILRSASASGDAKLALDANRAAVNVLDRLARLMPRNGGETSSLPLQVSPEWTRLRSALMTALEPFPEARIAVAEALSEAGELQ